VSVLRSQEPGSFGVLTGQFLTMDLQLPGCTPHTPLEAHRTAPNGSGQVNAGQKAYRASTVQKGS